VAVLFVDALQRMLKVAQEGQIAKHEKGVQDVRVETNQCVLSLRNELQF
jgi:B-cell receptor-associated protein 31